MNRPRPSSIRAIALPALALATATLALAACMPAGRAPAAVRAPGAVAIHGLGALHGLGAAQDLAGAGGRWIPTQLHAHSKRSGFATDGVAQLVEDARRAGIEALAVTDHDAVAQNAELAAMPGVIALRGTEWTSKTDGHANVYGFTGDAPFDPAASPAALLAEARRRGGLVIVNHPKDGMFAWKGDGPGDAAAVEVWNANYGYSGEQPAGAAAPGAGEATSWEALDTPSSPGASLGAELRLPTWGNLKDIVFSKNVNAIAWWQDALRQGARVAPTGGSDYHRWPQSVASPVTFVWARTPDAQGIYAGLRAGRTMIAKTVQGPRAELLADADGDGRFEAMVGDLVATGPGTRFRLRVTNAQGLEASLWSHGGEVLRAPVRGPDQAFELPASVATRGFVWARVDGGLRRGYLQAMTAAIYLP